MPDENVINTDVLVVGGGLAGIFAAVKAKEQGVDVTLAAKGTIGRSGQSPWAHGTMVVPPDAKGKPAELMQQAHTGGEYLNNRDWTERVIRESYDRFQDLLSWGQPFLKDDKGNFVKPFWGDKEQSGHLWGLEDGPLSWIQPLGRYLQKIGVHLLEKVMIVDLIKSNDVISGAVGVSTISTALYVFKAKAVVICAGAGGFRPVGGWPIGDLTADGQVMAYRAGAEITGKEFEDPHSFTPIKTVRTEIKPESVQFFPLLDAEGNNAGSGFDVGLDFAAHMGKAPLRRGKNEVFSNVALGMSVHTTEGIWPVDEDCNSGVPGLYAAGDSCGTMVTGATYSIGGSGTCNASVTGARAGMAAARYAKQTSKSAINQHDLAEAKELALMPMKRKGGFSPNWVTQYLKNIMMPYFVLRIKRGDRLQATLTLVEFMREHISPLIFARDPHELRLAHETKNMIVNAELKLRASLYRTESRGAHYREDYPRRSDPDWLAWVMLKEVDGKMTVFKKPIPQQWWPDLKIPYEQRYPARFPGELLRR